MKPRFRFVFGIISLLFLGVVVRLAWLQLWCRQDLSLRADEQAKRWIRELPRRAPIRDRHGVLLADSVPVASCYADPMGMGNPDRVARGLAPLLSMNPVELAHRFRQTKGSFVWVKRLLSMDEATAVEKANLAGVGLQWEYRRSYPNDALASSLLGYVGEEGQGLSGLEYFFNKQLIDRRPPRKSLRDGKGRRLVLDPREELPPSGGLTLTLDRSLQYIAERELDAGLIRSKARGGVVLIQDPWTGEILALAGRPAFSRNGRDRPSAAELKIPGIQWVFEPGSTLKVVTAAAALEEGLVRLDEILNCEAGKWRVSGVVIRDHEPERLITFTRAMEVSSNVGLAKVGLRLGRDKLYDYIRSFGFGTRTGVEVSGEEAGLLKPPVQWSGLSLPTISFGQEVGVTVLQLAAAYSAIANGGVLMEPRLCRQAEWPSGETRVWTVPSSVRRVVSKETSAQMRQILRGVVDRGTGTEAAVAGWTVAGKTGTAEKFDPRTRRYSATRYVASFCGFVPAENPRFTLVVVIDEPQGLEWGGLNAGPVFRAVASQALSLYGVPPDARGILQTSTSFSQKH